MCELGVYLLVPRVTRSLNSMVAVSHSSSTTRSSPKPAVASRVLKEFRELAIYGQEAAPIFAPLSPREVEILDNIAQGMTNKQVAYALSISEQTVKKHMSSILRKLSVNDRTQAVVYAMRQGWIRMSAESVGPATIACALGAAATGAA